MFSSILGGISFIFGGGFSFLEGFPSFFLMGEGFPSLMRRISIIFGLGFPSRSPSTAKIGVLDPKTGSWIHKVGFQHPKMWFWILQMGSWLP